MPKRKVWVVVADGAHARLFRAEGTNYTIEPLREEVYDPARRKGLDLVADRPGRTFDRSHDQGRHAMEPDTDPKRVEKQRFARHLAEVLETGLNEGAYNELVLVAAPRTLGDLRAVLSERVRTHVRREIDKDLTGLPQTELEAQLRPVIWPHLA